MKIAIKAISLKDHKGVAGRVRGEEKIFYPRPERENKGKNIGIPRGVSRGQGGVERAWKHFDGRRTVQVQSKLAVMNEITGHHLEEEQKNVFKPAQKCSITLKRKNWIGKFMEEKRSSWKEGSSVTRLQKE